MCFTLQLHLQTINSLKFDHPNFLTQGAGSYVLFFIYYYVLMTKTCWRSTACQFVFSYFIKRGQNVQFGRFCLFHTQNENPLMFNFPLFLAVDLPLQITAWPILGRGDLSQNYTNCKCISHDALLSVNNTIFCELNHLHLGKKYVWVMHKWLMSPTRYVHKTWKYMHVHIIIPRYVNTCILVHCVQLAMGWDIVLIIRPKFYC